MPRAYGSHKAGCDCDTCKAAEADYRRDLRKRRNAGNIQSTSTTASASPVVELKSRRTEQSAEPPPTAAAPPAYGAVAAGVMAEIESLPSFEGRPGLVSIALALARVLDSPGALPQHASAAHRLSETLDKLRKGADSSKSRLASVQRMTGSRKATG